jgi:hypothetical protein
LIHSRRFPEANLAKAVTKQQNTQNTHKTHKTHKTHNKHKHTNVKYRVDHKREARQHLLREWADGNARAARWLSKLQNEPGTEVVNDIRPFKRGQRSEQILFADAAEVVRSFRYGPLDADCSHVGMSTYLS